MSNQIILLDALLKEKKFEVASKMSDADFFEYFAVENILKDKELSYEEIEQGITDGGDDGGIDAMYIFLNGELINEAPDDFTDLKKQKPKIEIYAFQSKVAKTYKEKVIETFHRTVVDLFDMIHDSSKFQIEYNENIRGKFDLFKNIYKELISKFPEVIFHGFYVTKGNTDKIQDKLTVKANGIPEDVQNKIPTCNATFKFWGAKELFDEARREPKKTFALGIVEQFQPDKNLAVALCSISSYYKFLCNDNGSINKSLFESNVRDYQGNVSVNKEIMNTLNNSSGEDFWWLNNGVTILASKLSVSGKEVVIESPEIVNGLQTSNEIFNYFHAGGVDEKDRNILIRIICPQNEDSRDRIIKATNSQTQIPNVSLRGTDKIHRDIEDYFRTKGLFYDRRKNFYKNEGKPISKIISISFLSQSLMSIIRHKPDTSRARPSTLLNNNEEYNKLFNKNMPLTVYYTAVEVLRRVDAYLKAKKEISLSTKSDIKYYIALAASASIIGSLPDESNMSSLKMSDIDNVMDESYKKVFQHYMELGGNNKVAKGPNLREWLINDITSKKNEVVTID